jgi:DNA-nicking Smr family endonuclease
MGRRGKGDRGSTFNTPFRDLGRKLDRRRRQRSESPDAPPSPDPPPPDDEALFDQAMDDVTPLEDRDRRRVAPGAPSSPPGGGSEPADPDAEAYATLSGLVSGDIPFDLTDTDEYVEGHVAGFDRRILRKLRRGEFSVQAHLDLHGFYRQEARAQVERFVTESVVAGYRCVLIIPGRGLHSPGPGPVLKDVVRAWLSRGKIGRSVLAFTSARPVDGGAGALYVLLRRNRK